MIWISYLMLGSIVGFAAGLLGIGGGLIMVPALIEIFVSQGHSVDLAAKLAVGTSLATIVVTGFSSALAHHAHGAVLWPVWRDLLPGIIVGAALGALLTRVVDGSVVAILVGVFALFASVKMWTQWKPSPSGRLLGKIGMAIMGTLIGSISSLIGIGGGTLTVPFLAWARISVREAIATSAAVGLPIGLVGALSFIGVGLGDQRLPNYALGWVYLPAALMIASASVFMAPLGAKSVHRLPIPWIKRIFAVLLLVVGVRLLITSMGLIK